MKTDMKANKALHNEWFVQFTELVTGFAMDFKSLVVSDWNKHMLRCEIRAERKVLANLTDRELSDIGIDRATALTESRRDFKDLPSNR